MDIDIKQDKTKVEYTGNSFIVTMEAKITKEFPVEFNIVQPPKALPTVSENSSQQQE